MRRTLHLILATFGCVMGDLIFFRSAWREAREVGLRSFLSMRWAMVRLVANLGKKEAIKLTRMICAIVLEIAPRVELLRQALRHAADASHPSKAIKPAQITAAVHRFARDAVDEQLLQTMKGVHHV